MPILDKLSNLGEGRKLKHLQDIARLVNTFEPEVEDLEDLALRAKTAEFRQRHANGESLDDLLPEAFAVTREGARRTIGQRHFDVQLMGGAALHDGNIAEMKTGEGKTLVSTLPGYLNAVTGRGVHLVTVNDYLAKRDSEWMGGIYRFLGLDVGLIQATMTPEQRRPAYAADITYGTNNEFGFDYLRDNMAMRIEHCVQRDHWFAIVDEVDSILIDEARTPLIISGMVSDSAKWYQTFARVAPRLVRDEDYEVEESKYQVAVTERGVAKVEEILDLDNLYDNVNSMLVHHLHNALRAKELYKRDVAYVVTDGEVKIVDEFTGRVLEGRRYSEGLHQAIEAKEGVKIKEENQTLATITIQNYFKMYEKLAGMTGTAKTQLTEFEETYKIGVVEIPTNRPNVRDDRQDLVYRSEDEKWEAVADDLGERHERGQPVLVGTVSIEKSERLSKVLERRGVTHHVLNAKNHEKEARSWPRPAASGRSPSPRTWPDAASTSCSAATPSTSRARRWPRTGSTTTPTCCSRWTRTIGRRTKSRTSRRSPGTRDRPTASTTTWSGWAASTCWGPSGTSRGGSTTSCGVVPGARATRASRCSTSRWRTT